MYVSFLPCLLCSQFISSSFIWLPVFVAEYKSHSSSLCNYLQPPVTSSLLVPYILLSTVFIHVADWFSLGWNQVWRFGWKVLSDHDFTSNHSRFVLYREMIGAHSKKQTRQTLSGQHTELLVLNLAVNIVATRLWRLAFECLQRCAHRVYLCVSCHPHSKQL